MWELEEIKEFEGFKIRSVVVHPSDGRGAGLRIPLLETMYSILVSFVRIALLAAAPSNVRPAPTGETFYGVPWLRLRRLWHDRFLGSPLGYMKFPVLSLCSETHHKAARAMRAPFLLRPIRSRTGSRRRTDYGGQTVGAPGTAATCYS